MSKSMRKTGQTWSADDKQGAARVADSHPDVRVGGELRIHRRDGRIRDADTISPGNDPNPGNKPLSRECPKVS